jgi:hypothetical protein
MVDDDDQRRGMAVAAVTTQAPTSSHLHALLDATLPPQLHIALAPPHGEGPRLNRHRVRRLQG